MMSSDPEIRVTSHAAKRFKQRTGLSKKAAARHAEIAYERGARHADTKGRLHRYLDKVFLEYRNANELRVYGEFVFVFSGSTLITLWHLPKRLQGGVPKTEEG